MLKFFDVKMDAVPDDNNKAYMNTDKILTNIGEFGKFQKLLDGVVCLIYFFLSFQVLIMYFTTDTPPWKCRANSSECFFSGTFPEDDTRRCNMSRDEWYYTKPVKYSIVTQFDIHCDEQWLLELLSSVHFVGWGVGAIILGWMGDKYGRKTLMFPSVASIIVIGLVSSFLPNIYLIVVCRLFIGIFIPGAMVQANILMSELVGNKQRPFAIITPFFAYAVGYAILALKAYLLQNWKLLSIACTAPYVFILALYGFVPESVKWLQVNGRIDDAMMVFHKIALWNNKVLSSNVIFSFPVSDVNVDQPNTRKTFRNRKIIIQTLIQCFIWMVSSTCFFGLQLAANELEGSMYQDFVILSIVQIPAGVIAIGFSTKYGRKKANLISLLIAGVSCLGIAFIPARRNLYSGRVTLAIIGKMFASVAFQCLYLWSAEIFPISIRSQGMGYTQLAARIGATASPWVVKGLKPFGASVPFFVIAIPSLIGPVLGMWLPETSVDSAETECTNNKDTWGNPNGSYKTEMNTMETES